MRSHRARSGSKRTVDIRPERIAVGVCFQTPPWLCWQHGSSPLWPASDTALAIGKVTRHLLRR